jgi:hypothetical protein
MKRPGTKCIYQTLPGELTLLLQDGRTIIAGRDESPRILHPSGEIEPLTPETDPKIWAIFESVIKQILRPN